MTQTELETFLSIAVLPRSLAEETTANAALLEFAGSFSPRVEDRSDGNTFICVIDIAGTKKLFGPSLTLAQTLLDRVKKLGISAFVAVSSNFHTSTCYPRGMTGRDNPAVIARGNEAAALAALPLAVLDLSVEYGETFASWGIHTLGKLAVLPEKELIARMGQEGKRLRQLARGEHSHLFVPVEPELKLEESMELDTPVEFLDSLLFVVGVMLEQLIVRATGRMLALASVTITLSLDDKTSRTQASDSGCRPWCNGRTTEGFLF